MPSQALQHLKLAKAYIDDAYAAAEKKRLTEASAAIVIKTLAKAADHLNKARELNPAEVLWAEDKPGEKYELTQDFMNSYVLSQEGSAFLDAALDASDKNQDNILRHGKRDSRCVERGSEYLSNARDSLEKALIYTPHRPSIYYTLSRVYRYLGDKDNYLKMLNKRITFEKDNMDALKELDSVDDYPFDPLFKPRSFFASTSANMRLLFLMLAGFLLIGIGGANRIEALGAIGVLMIVIPGLMMWLR